MAQGGPSNEGVRTPDLSVLSERELEVLRLIAQGLRSSEIAAKLGRALPTIKSHRQQIGRKLGARTRVDLARIAFESFGEGKSDHLLALEALALPRGAVTLEGLLRALVEALDVEGALIALDREGRMLVTEHVLAGEAGWTGEIDIRGGPFAGDMTAPVCHGPGAMDAYPEGADVRALGASLVTGARLLTGDGRPIGLLVAYDRRHVAPVKSRCVVFRAFASRIGAELEAESRRHARA
ncbi:MAG: helix-turn-helix transcriptional regulator [Phycisphaerales bacterium]|nr:helix-turn-helix transcriptional regulator [Phycisphaerales bacterium]